MNIVDQIAQEVCDWHEWVELGWTEFGSDRALLRDDTTRTQRDYIRVGCDRCGFITWIPEG